MTEAIATTPAIAVSRARRGRRAVDAFLRTPPGLWFHAIAIAPTFFLLVAYSYPGVSFLLGLPAYGALMLLAVLWVVRTALFLVLRRRWSWWLTVAPSCGLVVLLLLQANVPLATRWAMSRGDFNHVVATLGPVTTTDGWTAVDVPGSIGTYDITRAMRVPGGYLFYEANGAFLDDAGFGYFPTPPSSEALANGSFESPSFHHLGGPWYSWTAHW